MPEESPNERDIFLKAVEIESRVERAIFLDDACGENADLRQRVERLLKLDESGSRFMGEDDQATQRMTSASSAPWVPPSPEVLDRALDDFKIEALLGRGGMGAVYRGVQSNLERTIALKILPPEFAEDESFAERFRREALAMAKLDHPNIVTIYDFGSIETEIETHGEIVPGKLFYFVMEFVRGTDLQLLIRSGYLDVESALDVTRQVCDALQYAHEEGYLHRDIKPANIFVTDSGEVKVGDFGLAKLADSSNENTESEWSLTQAGHVLGTPSYMAPESKTAEGKVDHRADIYSLGVMFYEMLTGSIPQGVFPPPSKKAAVDSRLDRVVMKAMQSEPDLRYQSASEVRTDLGFKPEKSVAPKPKPVRANRLTPILSMCGVLVLLVVFAGYWWLRDKPENPPSIGANSPNEPASPPPAAAESTPTGPAPSVEFPLSPPTRPLPDPTKLPRGQVHYWSEEHGFGTISDLDDIVEVVMGGSPINFLGLRANGEVIQQYFDHRPWSRVENVANVLTIKRSATRHNGCWLGEGGKIAYGWPDRLEYLKACPQSGHVDVACLSDLRRVPFAAFFLSEDGNIHGVGEVTGVQPPSEISDFVRITCQRATFFGIRENGEVHLWGEQASHFAPIFMGARLAKYYSDGIGSIGLTLQGKALPIGGANAVPVEYRDKQFIDVASGGDGLYAARTKAGNWLSWYDIEAPDPNVITMINNLERDAWGLNFIREGAAWIRPGAPLHEARLNAPSDLSQRAIADWILTLGGEKTTIRLKGENRDYRKAHELPEGALEVSLVHVSSQAFRDQHLKFLAPLTSLESLLLFDSGVQGEGLAHLVGYCPLKSVVLGRIDVETAKQLTRFPTIERMNIDSIDRAALRALTPMPNLQTLTLNGAGEIGDEQGIVAISAHPNLRKLDVSGCGLTDAAIPELKKLKQLETLYCKDNRFSESALFELVEMSNLKSLHLSHTVLTEEGAITMSRQLPDCEIVYWKDGREWVAKNGQTGMK